MKVTMSNEPLLPNIIRGALGNGSITSKSLLLDQSLQRSSFPGFSDVLGDSNLAFHVVVKHEVVWVDDGHGFRVRGGNMDVTTSERKDSPIQRIQSL